MSSCGFGTVGGDAVGHGILGSETMTHGVLAYTIRKSPERSIEVLSTSYFQDRGVNPFHLRHGARHSRCQAKQSHHYIQVPSSTAREEMIRVYEIIDSLLALCLIW